MLATRFIIVFSLLFAILAVTGRAEIEPAQKNKQLESLRQRIRALQSGLDDLGNKKHSVRTELRDNERLYGRLSNTLRQLNDEFTAQEKRLRSVRRERDLNQQKILDHKASLVGQIRAAYAMGRQERLQLILNQQDPLKVGRMLAYYGYLNNARVAQVKAFHAILEALRDSEQELLAGNERLRRLQKDQKAKLKSLEISRSDRNVLLAKLDRDYRDRQAELKQLKQDERALQSLIESLQKLVKEAPYDPEPKKSFSNAQKRLQWPVHGNLLQSYGSKTASGRSNGVLIRAREGDPVRAVSDGRVLYADWMVHYGLLIIIDHGRGYMTLYAFNQSLYKSVGEPVTSGEAIATVGHSGGRSIPALYFEVRKNGKPVNPVNWWKNAHNGDRN
ncbi:MAG: peptidoglycan DD-metalloendopeptidase family protein [Methylococcaceae bacterium]|nr:peptidoglycan DD-metalloendopeptidase family protein [Methylococcaceae bacterium]